MRLFNASGKGTTVIDSAPFFRPNPAHSTHGVALLQASLWNRCLRLLESEVPEQQFNTWVRPLQAVEENGVLRLLAPNRFVVDWLTANLRGRIEELLSAVADEKTPQIQLEVGSRAIANTAPGAMTNGNGARVSKAAASMVLGGRLNP